MPGKLLLKSGERGVAGGEREKVTGCWDWPIGDGECSQPARSNLQLASTHRGTR